MFSADTAQLAINVLQLTQQILGEVISLFPVALARPMTPWLTHLIHTLMYSLTIFNNTFDIYLSHNKLSKWVIILIE
jgi:hypothetical protein